VEIHTVLWLHVASNYDICRYTEVIAPCSFSINLCAEYPFKIYKLFNQSPDVTSVDISGSFSSDPEIYSMLCSSTVCNKKLNIVEWRRPFEIHVEIDRVKNDVEASHLNRWTAAER